VVELLGIPAHRIVEVPWSVPLPPASQVHSDLVPTRPYFLWPAITYPHKNHQMLLAAFAELIASGVDAELVLTGGVGPCESQVLSTISQFGIEDRVRRLGRIPSADLDALYRSAIATVVPSTYEGFGLPVLEAQLRECLVIAADAGSLPEVALPSGLVDPHDVAGWASAMKELSELSDDARRRRIHSGLESAQGFTPLRTAAAQLEAYRRVLV
jgi:glycosyltransferase involved in cell wall biosynthesis